MSKSVNSKYIDANFGMAKCREMLNSFSPALDIVNRVLVANPTYICAIVEKMKLQLSSQDWDQCLEVAQRALSIDENCLEAHRYQILELLCRDGRYQEAAESIAHLFQLMERLEPNSHYLYFDYSRVFARIVSFQWSK
jgi:tetratricopeptide repeat protein 21B